MVVRQEVLLMTDLGLWLGAALIVVGVIGVASAIPVTDVLARRMPQWRFTRGDVERLGSTTFLVASVGILLMCAGAALIYTAIVG